MKNPNDLKPIDKLGLPPTNDARENALREYCLIVIQGVESALTKIHGKEKALLLINKAKDWIGQEQESAFNANAPAADCVAWIVKNINDPRLSN